MDNEEKPQKRWSFNADITIWLLKLLHAIILLIVAMLAIVDKWPV